MRFRKSAPTSWAGFVALALGVLLVALPGCGRNKVTVDVDVDSFIDPADLTGQYNAPAGVPELALELDPVSVNLVEGFSGVGPAEEMTLEVAVSYDNISGEGEARFTLFFAETAADVFNTPAVGHIDANLVPQAITNGTTRIAANQRILDLFELDHMYMGLRFQWMPQTVAPLEGSYTITSIRAEVVSTVQIF